MKTGTDGAGRPPSAEIITLLQKPKGAAKGPRFRRPANATSSTIPPGPTGAPAPARPPVAAPGGDVGSQVDQLCAAMSGLGSTPPAGPASVAMEIENLLKTARPATVDLVQLEHAIHDPPQRLEVIEMDNILNPTWEGYEPKRKVFALDRPYKSRRPNPLAKLARPLVLVGQSLLGGAGAIGLLAIAYLVAPWCLPVAMILMATAAVAYDTGKPVSAFGWVSLVGFLVIVGCTLESTLDGLSALGSLIVTLATTGTTYRIAALSTLAGLILIGWCRVFPPLPDKPRRYAIDDFVEKQAYGDAAIGTAAKLHSALNRDASPTKYAPKFLD